MIDKDILAAARTASCKLKDAKHNEASEAARRAQEAAIAEKVPHGTFQVPAPKREPLSDIATRADIQRVADVLSMMLDLHEELDARLTRLEQARSWRPGWGRRI